MIHRLSALGIAYKDEQISVGAGGLVRAQYFQHKMDGKTIRCEVSFSDPNERLGPAMIRYICNRLKINPSFFGLNLG